MSVHRTAYVSNDALIVLGDDVTIGPNAYIGLHIAVVDDAKIGPNVEIICPTWVMGRLTIGAGARIMSADDWFVVHDPGDPYTWTVTRHRDGGWVCHAGCVTGIRPSPDIDFTDVTVYVNAKYAAVREKMMTRVLAEIEARDNPGGSPDERDNPRDPGGG